MSRTSYILRNLDGFHKEPAHLVNILPPRKVQTKALGHVLAILVGFAAAIILLAIEGAL